MKLFTLTALMVMLRLLGLSQCITPTVTADGPLVFCPGGSVTLSATIEGTNTWAKKADFGGGIRAGAIGFSIGNKGYLGLGYIRGEYKRDFWEYDPVTDVWTQKADFGGSTRNGAVGFSIGNKGYAGLGYDLTFRNDFGEYDPVENKWYKLADFGGTPRWFAAGFSIGAKGYVGTGFDNSNRKDFWEYNPATDKWTQKADFGGSARFRARGFAIGNRGYLGTGNEGTFDRQQHTKDFWEYDPVFDKWTKKADFPGSGRTGAVSFGLESKGYLGMGDQGPGDLPKDMWEYTKATDTWVRKADFAGPLGLYLSVGFAIGRKGYVGTGLDGVGIDNTFWAYDPDVTYKWSNGATTPSITVTQSGSYTVAVTTADGCVSTSAPIVVGGNGPAWVLDKDADGYYTGTPVSNCAKPGDGYVPEDNAKPGDCDDNNAAINPSAVDIPDDGIDQNCNGFQMTTWYFDGDKDGFGTATSTATVDDNTSMTGSGYIRTAGDCNDFNAAINPNALDIPDDGIDQNCDSFDATAWYRDADGDGFGTTADKKVAGPKPDGYVSNSSDCDDTRVTFEDKDGDGYGSETKVACKGVPNNTDCNDSDFTINLQTLWVLDSDTDGFYTGNPVQGCGSPGTGYVINNNVRPGDCNDNNASVNPNGVEITDDGIDQDCDGFDRKTWYRDADGDGYGAGASTVTSNNQPQGYVGRGGDCDDNRASVYPSAAEVCGNNTDDDCDGQVDEGCTTLPSITSLTLINATTDKDINALTNGAVIDLATIAGRAINVRANTTPARVGSVRMVLSGRQSRTQMENSAPYALFSNNGANYASWIPAAGNYTLTATPYTGSNGSGTAGTPLTISFTVADNQVALTGFTLVNAATDKDIGALTDGMVIDLGQTPQLNIRANPRSANVSSVRFGVNSTTNHRTENSAPYALAGNNGTNYYNWSVAPGSYTIRATPFSADNAGGTAGTPITVTITVVNTAKAAPQQSRVALNNSTEDVKLAAGAFKLQLTAYPNPSSTYFTVQVQSPVNEVVQVRIADAAGRVVEAKGNVAPNATLYIGSGYSSGVYFVEAVQGSQRQVLKLVKQTE